MLPEYDPDLLLQAWNAFLKDQSVLPEVNPHVAASWKRCWGRLHPRQREQMRRLSPEHLLATQVARFDLISLARPVMEDIYQFIANSDSVIVLTNSAGYVLDLLGDDQMLEIVAGFGIVPGAVLSEMGIGTNAFALAIQERLPVRVAGAEHFLAMFHELSEAAAPIFDLSGRPLGSIGVINFSFHYHPHTLGMVVAGARAIEGQRQSDYLLAEQNSQLASLNAIIEANTDGLLVINERGKIMQMNDAACRILGIARQSAQGRTLNELIEYPGFLDEAVTNRDPLKDVEIKLQVADRTINCVISLNYILNNKAIKWVIARLRQADEVRELVQHQVGAEAPLTLEDIPGDSPAIRRVQRFVKIASPAQASILIRGESGTGKNVLASALHNASPRRDAPFLIVGCTSIPHEWMLRELLGFDEGIERKKPGGRPSKFELAQGGTLFFQNVDDLPLEAQAVLLNVLDLGIIQRLGSNRPVQVDVRVIASTSANIEKLIAQGNFRADLYYRLSSFEVILPPLRARLQDVPMLAARILLRISRQIKRELKLGAGCLELLMDYSWPGNVRELETTLSRAAIATGAGGEILPAMLPDYILSPEKGQTESELISVQPLYQVERDSILLAARACNGNTSEMARLLGIGRTTVWRRVREMKIELDEFRYGRAD